ncbi:MAG: hypothetical protein KF900_05945 [Bacteroidetes bacterium]|nr:hypothetical protein [Bacteroidota bacterium]
MNAIKILSLSLFLTGAAINTQAKTEYVTSVFGEYPAKTVCIKHPAADNVNAYFSEATVISFEIFKIGDKAAFITSLQSNADVESVTEGALTGDFQMITITMKTAQNKAWFAALLKKAGSRDIRINHMELKSLDEL